VINLLTIALLLLQTWRAPYHGAIHPTSTGGGGGGGAINDSFTGGAVDTGVWTVHTAVSGTVSQSGGDLIITGDGAWGDAYIESIATFDRSLGDITITVSLNADNCDNGRGTIGWGDGGNLDASGVKNDLFLPFGTSFQLANYHVGTGSDPQFHILTWTCTTSADETITIKIKSAGGADFTLNGGSVDANSIDGSAGESSLTVGHVFLSSYSGAATFHSITVTQ